MFDFENLEVDKKAKALNSIVYKSIIVADALDATNKKSAEVGLFKYSFEHCRRNQQCCLT